MELARTDQNSRKLTVHFTVVENGIVIRNNTDLQYAIFGQFKNLDFESQTRHTNKVHHSTCFYMSNDYHTFLNDMRVASTPLA